ncbi:MAG TPA: right-handed parallel beta-helix repeat-containing protein [Bacillota bacterium]|nr:right-handed parallel beta-helix repeat-containing protein [Bacillota bacterium]
MRKVFHIDDYLDRSRGCDATQAVIDMIAAVRENGGGTIVFFKGEYHFYAHEAQQHTCYPYGCGGSQKTAFLLTQMKDVTVDGGGSDFVFHGIIVPFICDGSKNIVLENFKVSYDRPFHTELLVTGRDEKTGSFECVLDREHYPTHTEDGHFDAFTPYMELTQGNSLLTEYDAVRKEPAYSSTYYVLDRGQSPDGKYGGGFFGWYWTEETGTDTLRMYMPGKQLPRVGNVMTYLNDGRPCVSAFIHESENVTLRNADVFDSGGMCIVGQLSRDIFLDSVRMRLAEKGEIGYIPGRVVSASADATHFLCCMGKLSMTNCVFDNMLDDGTNIHGMYRFICGTEGKHTFIIKNSEPDTASYYREGDTVSAVKMTDFQEIVHAVVKEVRQDGAITRVTVDGDVSCVPCSGYALDNLTTAPDEVHISNVKTGSNRPRGFLIATLGKVLIENCTFHNSSSGIHMQPFGEVCMESQGVEDVTIRDCRFVNCGFSDNAPAINIAPAVLEGIAPVHRNITVTGCRFETFGAPSISANNTANLCIKDNTFVKTSDYDPMAFCRQVILQDCNI